MGETGKKIKDGRKLRGLTQRELSAASGVSLSVIRKLEQGDREGARMETLRALAGALRFSTMDLVGAPSEEGPIGDTHETWKAVRDELNSPPVRYDSDDERPSKDGVSLVLADVVPLYREHKFTELARALPLLLRDADALGADGRRVRVRVLQVAAGALTHTRQFKTAEEVAKRILDDAADRMESAATVNTLCWLLMRQGRLDEALSWATQWADELEPRFTRASEGEFAAWGLLLLNVSAAAARNNQPGVAADALKFARSAATAIGHEVQPAHENMRTFGPTSVRMRVVEDALVRDQPDVALRLAERIPRYRVQPSASVRARHGLDVAKAYTQLGRYGQAFEKLAKVQAFSPEWFPNQSPARDVLRSVVAGRRTLTPEMRAMADALRLHL
ncbi:helix-turn-helix domain-containing protein [Streptomyces sp. NPDC087212]|uniref:helix-turn-helix domain-containing protein n=1 Tax=Streptomyces sp. NPDC087212 TaxID=3365766 RepID=UPI00380DC0CF